MSSTGPGHVRAEPTSALPLDLVEQQMLRLQTLYFLGVAIWTVTAFMDWWLQPQGDIGPYGLTIQISAAALALATGLFVRYAPVSQSLKSDVGVFGIIPHTLALGIINAWVERPIDMRPVSGAVVAILFFGMMAPGRPSRMFIASLIAASMDPVGVWIAHLRGLPVPDPLTTVLLFYPNYVCAGLSVVPAQVLYALGRKLQSARALGSYELIERLGEGGMGEVWRGHHRMLARTAAIKLVRPEMLGISPDKASAMLHRFRREAQATAALTSPHTIRIFDFGLSDTGAFYYVMEMLDGRDLESLVRTFGPMGAPRAMAIVRQMCLSLAEAHARGLIHRDVKPANVFLCRMGLEFDFVKVLDFGLVKHGGVTYADGVTTIDPRKPTTLGTPGYMAPEAILGSDYVDASVDVYAIGCVTYFLLTGHAVFEADSPLKKLMHHLQDRPVPPSIRSEIPIPPEVDAFVLACLEKDPARRPGDAAEVLELLSKTSLPAWDQAAAARWWRVNLPDLAQNDRVEMAERSDRAGRTPVVMGEKPWTG
jgi:serine/threonine-protein kinase